MVPETDAAHNARWLEGWDAVVRWAPRLNQPRHARGIAGWGN
jgi:hypothetical protein